jgi:hypothetical protein
MALTEFLILRKPPTGPALGRPEDRLSGCLEERTALIQPIANSFTPSRESKAGSLPSFTPVGASAIGSFSARPARSNERF